MLIGGLLADGILQRLTGALEVDTTYLLRTGIRAAVIWVLAWVAWRVVLHLARRIIAAVDDGDDNTLTAAEKRGQTIAQLLRSVGGVTIIVVALLLTLNLFIDIAPLLAGAGILGLAVSFGAQSLVKDLIAGFFILFENQFAVGDVVEVAGKGGVVESMSLRVVQLRDLEGRIHVVPNGQIGVVTNMTKGWSR
ncbi:MAG TPA: mechanosensitive ion channel domain-containing protein, partial [Gemmatimonadales bacterium]|nr:mechanosensitive ion channel domain-containing protein [Gemmatimonadales bacterium]